MRGKRIICELEKGGHYALPKLENGEDKMSQYETSSSVSRFLKPRRAALLASAAGIGFAALVSGTSFYQPVPFMGISPAAAAETMVQPSGFADLVARVKPAVISVQVRGDGVGRAVAAFVAAKRRHG
jgi:hypothetical protein